MDNNRLKEQVNFIVEADNLKKIYRRNYLNDGSRFENDAEHSWHLGLMSLLLFEYAEGKDSLDPLRVLKMVLIHDIVEIDAGDTYCYDDFSAEEKHQREQKAAERLFSLLPVDQAGEFKNIWEEFEEGKSPEARFAAALDRFQPLLLNYISGGKSWREHGVTREQVIQRNEKIQDGAPELWDFVQGLIEDAVGKGYFGTGR